ncbi:MAG: DUF4038 domain-containing protein, partial [Armatimonadota bacterium]|nr:DUF4038 domain-containing protein [Armatimonadota bacterium]
LWVHGGDQIPDAARAACQHRIMVGIREVAPAHLHTAHWRRPPQPDLSRAVAPFTDVDVEMIYSASLTYYGCLRNWNNVLGLPPIPAYMGESYYERQERFNPPGPWPAYACRRQAYWSLLSGAGHVYGDERPKLVTHEELNTPGTLDMVRVKALFASLPWHSLVPDDAVAGYQVFRNDEGERGTPGIDSARAHLENDYVAAACAWDGGEATLGLAYVPPTGTATRTLRVALDRFAAAPAVRWYNPYTGAWTNLGTFPNRGTRNFVTPGDNGSGSNDWVLYVAV